VAIGGLGERAARGGRAERATVNDLRRQGEAIRSSTTTSIRAWHHVHGPAAGTAKGSASDGNPAHDRTWLAGGGTLSSSKCASRPVPGRDDSSPILLIRFVGKARRSFRQGFANVRVSRFRPLGKARTPAHRNTTPDR